MCPRKYIFAKNDIKINGVLYQKYYVILYDIKINVLLYDIKNIM